MFLALLFVLINCAIPIVSVRADVPPPPNESALFIYALHWDDEAEVPVITGDGTAIPDLNTAYPGVNSLDDVEFTLIEVKPGDTMSENPSQAEAEAFYAEKSVDPTYTKQTGLTNDDGGNSFYCFNTGWIKSARYVVFQSNIPVNETMKAAPFAVTIPQMKPDGSGWNNIVHVYTKNSSTLGAAKLYKYDGEVNKNAALSGARFSLYRTGKDGNPDTIIDDTLLTNSSGYTQIVSNLLPGEYYFIETEAPQNYLPNYTKHPFTITEHAYTRTGEIDSTKVVSVGAIAGSGGIIVDDNVANYKAAVINKSLTTNPSADIGETNTWQLEVTVPKDIGAYQEFVVNDTIDSRLTYQGNVKVQVQTTPGGAYTDLNLGAFSVSTPTSPSNLFSVRFKDTTFPGSLTELVGALKVKILFDTIINNTAVPAVDIPNTASLTYNNSFVGGTIAAAQTPIVVTGGRKFLKTDPADVPLATAQFIIYRIKNSVNEYAIQDPATKAVTWNTDSTLATTFTSNVDGTFELSGVAYGNYYLHETVAPAGYNLLTTDKYFTVDVNSYGLGAVIQIKNSNRPIIPVTGGIGTIIFFLGGGLLMGGAAFILARNKKSAQNDVV